MGVVLTLLRHSCPLQAIVAAFGLDEPTIADWQACGGEHCQRVHERMVHQGQGDLEHVQADELGVKMGGYLVGCAYNFCWYHESLPLAAPEGAPKVAGAGSRHGGRVDRPPVDDAGTVALPGPAASRGHAPERQSSLVGLAVSPLRFTYDFIENSEEFALNIPGRALVEKT